jgi:hypothetical protein
LADYLVDIVNDDEGNKPARLEKLFADYSNYLKSVAPSEADINDDEHQNVLPAKLEAMVAALMAANPTLRKEDAMHHLLHTAAGRRLAEHLNNISKRKDEPMQVDITKLHNIASVTEIAKNVIDDKVALTEHQFTEIVTGHAKLNRQAGESEAKAFERIFMDPSNGELRKAYALTKGYYGEA